MNTISVEEGIKRYFEGEPVKLMISETGRFEDLRPVDAQLYLKMLLRSDRMVFFEDEKTQEWAKEQWFKEYKEAKKKEAVKKKKDLFHQICDELDAKIAKGERPTDEEEKRLTDAIVIEEEEDWE